MKSTRPRGERVTLFVSAALVLLAVLGARALHLRGRPKLPSPEASK